MGNQGHRRSDFYAIIAAPPLLAPCNANRIALIGGVAVAWPLTVRVQQAERMRRIGMLMAAREDDAEAHARVALLRQGLNQLGWIEGLNINFDYRWAGGDAARAKTNAAELVSQKPAVIIANSTLALAAVRNETSTIPIVFLVVGDPIGQGFVSSLAHPGGNITGFTSFEFATGAKWLELIKEVVPEIRRVAFIFNPAGGPYAEKFVEAIAPLASSFGIDLVVSPTRDTAEIDRAQFRASRKAVLLSVRMPSPFRIVAS